MHEYDLIADWYATQRIDREGDLRVWSVMRENRPLEQRVGHRCHDHHDAVGGRRHGREVVLAHPAGDERHERQPEEQMQIRPEDARR